MTKKEIINKYLGVRYNFRGRSVKVGLDCYGLIFLIYKDLNIILLDIDYERDVNIDFGNFMLTEYYQQWEKVNKPSFADIIMFKNIEGIAKHAGIVLDENDFIHSCNRTGVIVSNYHRAPWSTIIEDFYRYKR